MRHKHADLIHAWADGAEIQRFSMMSDSTWRWVDDHAPEWLGVDDYRIKPEEKKPVVRWLWALKGVDCYIISTAFYSDEESKSLFRDNPIKLEWSRTEFPE